MYGQEAIHELISTEEAFLDDLGAVLELYSFETCRSVLSPEEHDEVIGHLRELFELSQQLLKRLYQRRGAGGAVYRLG